MCRFPYRMIADLQRKSRVAMRRADAKNPA